MGGKLKVTLLVNADIGPNAASAPGQEGYRVAKALQAHGTLGRVCCLGVEPDCELPSEMVSAYCRNRWHRVLIGLINKLHRYYPAVRGRRRTEEWMDKYFSSVVDGCEQDILYCPKPLYPNTMAQARYRGMRVIAETSVLHPRFNLEMVSEEKRRLSLRGAAGYTDEKRVRNIEAALAECERVFAWDQFIQQSYIKYGVPEEKFMLDTAFSPPGIDVQHFSPRDSGGVDGFVVLHLSVMSIIKGIPYLLEAWDKVKSDVQGTLCLSGPVDRDMRKLRRRYTDSTILWTGREHNPVDRYRQSSVFVSPSISDAGPRTVLEAMACGVPVIVSSHCGISRLVTHGQDGFVYEYGNVDELAGYLKWCATHREELATMGRRARRTALDHNIADYGDAVEKRVESVIKLVEGRQ